MTMKHRTWFPFIVVGLTFALMAVVLVYVEGRATLPNPNVPEGYVLSIEEVDYPGDVSYIWGNYYLTQDVDVTRDRLLAQRVPADFRDLHFELILIIDVYQRGENLEAESRMDILQSEYSWLP
jgi:hypothetical protein